MALVSQAAKTRRARNARSMLRELLVLYESLLGGVELAGAHRRLLVATAPSRRDVVEAHRGRIGLEVSYKK